MGRIKDVAGQEKTGFRGLWPRRPRLAQAFGLGMTRRWQGCQRQVAHRRDVCREADHLDLVAPLTSRSTQGQRRDHVRSAAGDARMLRGLRRRRPRLARFDDMDEVTRNGSVEPQAEGSLEGEFAYDNSDESTLKAKPWQQPALKARRAWLGDVIQAQSDRRGDCPHIHSKLRGPFFGPAHTYQAVA